MSKGKILKISVITFIITLFLVYFFGCSPIKSLCFAHGIIGRICFFLLMFLLGVLGTCLIFKYTNIEVYFTKDGWREFLGLFHIERRELICLCVLIIVGGGLRLAGIDWGVDRIFQADEAKLVIPTTEMARLHTPYHGAFGYPNQLISKAAAFIILIASRIYPIPLEPSQSVIPYFIFRAVVAMFSTGTIAISYLIGNKLHKRLGILFASMVALYPEYILMAKQITGDATAHFFMALVILASLCYIDSLSKMSVFCMSAFAAMATMEKWHSAVACFYIAVIIIFNCKGIKNFFEHGVFAFLSYVSCLFLITPNMLWSIREAAEGIVYMYSYDKAGVTPYIDLMRGYVNDIKLYSGLGFLILVVLGIVFMFRNYTKKYIILLLGLIKLMILCFLNRGFPRWGQEFYYVVLLVAAMGVLLLINNSRKSWKGIGYSLYALVCACFLTGCILIAVTGVLSEQDTRIVQDNWCRENGIDSYNALSGYYTAFNPGGVSAYDGLGAYGLYYFLDDESRIIWEDVEEQKEYLILSSYIWEPYAKQREDESIPIVREFLSSGYDIFWGGGPCAGITSSRNEFVRIYEFGKQTARIWNGANTGPDIIVYDFSGIR